MTLDESVGLDFVGPEAVRGNSQLSCGHVTRKRRDAYEGGEQKPERAGLQLRGARNRAEH